MSDENAAPAEERAGGLRDEITGPDPGRSADSAQFIHALALLRMAAGDTYKKLQTRTGIPSSTLYDTLTGKRRARTDVIKQVARVYAQDQEQADGWMRHWDQLVLADRRPPAPPPAAEVEDTSETSAMATTAASAAPRSLFRGKRAAIALSALTLVAVVSAMLIVNAVGGGSEDGGTAPHGPTVRLTVHNIDLTCRPLRTLECSLNLYRDPRAPRTEANVAARTWHGDALEAECVISDGRKITDEEGMASSRWYHVRVPGTDGMGWLPGVRTRNSTEVPACKATEVVPAVPR